MRILSVGNLYPPHHFGGYELIWKSAVDHLRQAGHEVRVLASDFHQPGVEAVDEPDVFRALRWYWREGEFPALSVRERIAIERQGRATFDTHVDELRPDVVSWWPMGGMSLGLIDQARRRGVQGAGVVGDDWMIYGPRVDGWLRMLGRRPLRPLRRPIEWLTRLPTRFDPSPFHWLFISETVRHHALASGLALPRSEVAHPGIDPSLFPPAPRPDWDWRLLYAGRIDERKGIATAVEALALLPPQATLTIDGPGDAGFLEHLRALASERGVSERVTFSKRPRSELGDLYALSDVLVFPVQWEEPWGLVPLEAMSVGTPVVATGAGGSGEYLRDGSNCVLFDRESGAAGLAAAVARLASEPALRARLTEHGRETAAGITERAFNDAVLDALERVSRRPRRAGS